MAIFGRAFPIRPWISKPQPTAGGTTYNVSVTEAASATDTLDAAAVFANSFTESGSATDTPSSAAVFANTVSEAGSATDTDSSAAVFGSSITETGAANDSGDATGAFGAAITETASATETEDATGGSGVEVVRVGGGAGEPHTFSRRRWEELRKALHDARHKALTAERKKKREALDRAADAAAHALAIVRKEEEDLTRATIAKMGAMTRALEAATSAETIATVLRNANAVVMLAKTIERQIADEEDEDDAVMLLLS